MKSCKCECLDTQIQLLNQSDAESFETRYTDYCNMLKKEYIDQEELDV